VTTASPEVQERRRGRESGRDALANQGDRPPTLSPDVVLSISRGGAQAAAPSVSNDLSQQFRAGLPPQVAPGQARTADTGERRTTGGAPGLSAGKDTGGHSK
jgi:hypothetical protein